MSEPMPRSKWQSISALPRFFVFAYVWSWIFWIPMVLAYRNRGPVPEDAGALQGIPVWALVAALIGGYGPTIAALVLTGRQEGKPGVKALLQRLKIWRVGWSWHLFAWLSPVVFVVVAIAILYARGGNLGEPNLQRLRLIPIALFFAIPFGPLGEELGWRGYALPRLQEKYSALTASIALGLIWTFWHTPMFWAPGGTVISGGPVTLWAVAKYVAFLVGLAILYTWLYNNTKGSVLLAVIFHTTANAMLPLIAFPDRGDDAGRLVDELSIIPIWLTVAVVLAIYGPKTLTRRTPEP